MYIRRHAEKAVKKLSSMFGAVLVAGPRQVGKTTMLREMTSDVGYVTLADPQKSDVAAFDLLDKIPNIKRGSGGVICLYDDLVTLKANDRVIPVKYL